MTIEEKVIANLKYAIRWNDKPTQKSMEVAIASLEAWEKVRQEINDLFSKPACYMPNYDAYKMFLEIIDKHLQKTSETETWNGYHGQITAPKGTFERIISDTDDEDDI